MFVTPRPFKLSSSAFMFGFMSTPFSGFWCVRSPLSAAWGARPFRGVAQQCVALCLLSVDALGGLFLGCDFVHASSVFFLSKKVFTNDHESFGSVRKYLKECVNG